MLVILNNVLLNKIFLTSLLVVALFPMVSYSDYWSDDTYTHFSKNEPLREMLQAMALDQDLPIVVSDKVTDNISAYFRMKKPSEIFSILQRTYGLVAYFDGEALYVYKNEEIMSKTITLNKSPVKFLEKALFDTSAMDEKVKKEVKWRINTKLNSVTFRAGQRFIDLTQNLAEKLNSNNYIYHWKDKSGKFHYGNNPPFGNEQYMDIVSISATSGASSTYHATAVTGSTNKTPETDIKTNTNETSASTTAPPEASDESPSPATSSMTLIY